MPATSMDAVDAAVARVAATKDAWTKVPIADRVRYLETILEGVLAVSEGWVADICKLKGLTPDDPRTGEEWVAGPMVTVRNVKLLIKALEAGGAPKPPKMTTRADGRQVATVFPASLLERAMQPGIRAEVWIERGKPASQGRAYRESTGHGKVALVLGAGNVSSIPPMDLLYKLFVENEVVVLKMNPVNAAVGPHLEKAFKCLIDEGFLAIVYGGADVGAHLSNHPSVDTLHVTGSDKTYDAIVWGTDPEERARRKAAKDPKNTRPFSSELGCVSPLFVVPGPWSDADMDYHARNVASMVAQNASFNCNAAKVLVLPKGWILRETFLKKIDAALADTKARKAYYPGAEDRYRGFLEHYPKARPLGPSNPGVVPWTVIPDVPADAKEYALNNEAFCGVLAQVTLGSDDPATYLREAVAFANESIWGTLSCSMLIHPTTQRDFAAAFDTAIADLRYGGIGVNCWAAFVYALVSTTWGAFPGHPPEDIRSGTGVVHNTFLFDHPEKSVVYAPFRMRMTPAYFADHKTLDRLGRAGMNLEAHPTFGGLVDAALAAMKG
ncbi:MAG: aldehyde dehydrogenase family protein [Polyangiaceae bacterium]